MFIPANILRKLYTVGSLTDLGQRVTFSLKNRLKQGYLQRLKHIKLNDQPLSLDDIYLVLGPDKRIKASELNIGEDIAFALGQNLVFEINTNSQFVDKPACTVDIHLDVHPFGSIHFEFTDVVRTPTDSQSNIPRNPANDYSADIINKRREFIQQQCKFRPEQLFIGNNNAEELNGNIEHFVGYAQVPIGIAGPVQVNGDYANGEYLVPLATTEGTLVASYNRGMKLLNLSGGADVTVVEDRMQRAPVFVLPNAKQAKAFVNWINEHLADITKEAEATDRFVKLLEIDCYQSIRFAYLRFNFATADAAGQNMVGQATFAACNWILANYQGIENFYLESNFATDKKASQINILKTRGKRVTAEVTIKSADLYSHLGVTPEQIDTHARISSVGSFMSGVNNTGLHAANGIAAIFIATGQDAANVAESSAGMLYSDISKDGDLYLSLTLPSLIVATIGGGTGLATQSECLQIMQCKGVGNARKLAEIIAVTALAGEISLAAAISSFDWVAAHETYGRNG